MPRKFLKRCMPDHKKLRAHPSMQRFGRGLMEPSLWHLNRRSVSLALALGLFIGFMPILGQTIVAAALAIYFRVNLPVAVLGSWISNPFTFALIYFYAYKVGAWILQVPVGAYSFEMTWEWFQTDLLQIWQPFLLGCLVCGIIAAALGVLFVRLLWRLMVIRSWLARRRNRG